MSDFSIAVRQFVDAIIRQRDERLRAGAWLEGDLTSAEALQAWNAAVGLGDAVREAYALARGLAPDAGARGEVVAAMNHHQALMAADSDEVDDIAFGSAYGEAIGLLTHYIGAESADTQNYYDIAKAMKSGIGKDLFIHQMQGKQDPKSIEFATSEFFRKHKWEKGLKPEDKKSEMESAKRAARRSREKLKGD